MQSTAKTRGKGWIGEFYDVIENGETKEKDPKKTKPRTEAIFFFTCFFFGFICFC